MPSTRRNVLTVATTPKNRVNRIVHPILEESVLQQPTTGPIVASREEHFLGGIEVKRTKFLQHAFLFNRSLTFYVEHEHYIRLLFLVITLMNLQCSLTLFHELAVILLDGSVLLFSW